MCPRIGIATLGDVRWNPRCRRFYASWTLNLGREETTHSSAGEVTTGGVLPGVVIRSPGFPARVPVTRLASTSSTAMDLNLDTAITAMSALMNNWSGAIGETTTSCEA